MIAPEQPGLAERVAELEAEQARTELRVQAIFNMIAAACRAAGLDPRPLLEVVR